MTMLMRKRTRGRDDDGLKKKKQQNCSSDYTPEFFKVFLPHLSAYQLHIPRAFIHQYKETIQKKLILKENGGKLWHVEVSKTVDGYFITKGWENFVTHHALCSGDFLVFRYDGNATFSVKIFGINGCKKEILASSNIATQVKVEHETDEVAVAKQTSLVHTREVETNCMELSQKKPDNDKSADLEKETHSRLLRSASKIAERTSSRNGTELAEADAPYFIGSVNSLLMRAMLIPKKMVTEFNVKLKPKMFLCHNERRWLVLVRKHRDGRRTFGRGWMTFCKDNCLSVGDRCMFKFGTAGAINEVEVRVLSDAGKRQPSIKVEA